MKLLYLLIPGLFLACSSSRQSGTPVGNELPACITDKIKRMDSLPEENAGRKLYRYRFEGKTVYYLTGPCCDQFSELFDSTCQLLGHPDGGFTGRGDGSLPGFKEQATEEQLIWSSQSGKSIQDSRDSFQVR